MGEPEAGSWTGSTRSGDDMLSDCGPTTIWEASALTPSGIWIIASRRLLQNGKSQRRSLIISFFAYEQTIARIGHHSSSKSPSLKDKEKKQNKSTQHLNKHKTVVSAMPKVPRHGMRSNPLADKPKKLPGSLQFVLRSTILDCH